MRLQQWPIKYLNLKLKLKKNEYSSFISNTRNDELIDELQRVKVNLNKTKEYRIQIGD